MLRPNFPMLILNVVSTAFISIITGGGHFGENKLVCWKKFRNSCHVVWLNSF